MDSEEKKTAAINFFIIIKYKVTKKIINGFRRKYSLILRKCMTKFTERRHLNN